MILSNIREDHYGLYELLWELNTLHPSESPTAKLMAARAALLPLLERGQVQLFSTHWGSPDYEEIDGPSAIELVSDDDSWLPPHEITGAYIVLGISAH